MEPLTVPAVAVMVATPAPSVVTLPVAVTLATALGLDFQFTTFVRSIWVLSLKLPVAVS
jgi:hypothetical protein